MNNAISIQRISKRYALGSHGKGYRTLRESLANVATATCRRLGTLARLWSGASTTTKSERAAREIWALKDVSLEIKPGEAVGILGRNGAGKSTLLKVLSRITEPTAGRATYRGRLGSLLEVGTGFHPELTGRENIYLNGSLLNMRRREIDRKFDEIVDFAEIEAFLDTPVKRYSSGMYVRLGFAVAAHLAPEILLIDEVLAVGDLRFQRKCLEFAKRLCRSNATLLLVSHNMFSIKAMCTRAVYLSGGTVAYDGEPSRAIELYEKDSRMGMLSWAEDAVGTDPSRRPIRITDIDVLDEDGRPRTVFDFGEQMRVRLHYTAYQTIDNPNFIVAFIRSDNVSCCSHTTAMDGLAIPSVSGRGVVELLTPPLKLVSELYTLHVLVRDTASERLYSAQVGSTFHVRHALYSTHYGVFHEPAQWAVRSDAPATYQESVKVP
jgi:lipopolysaccharide transport system ATP-binding protein